ncbi:MAG: sulfatase-like hydrolase/transferase [Candidatus Micrarchaeaceae archaeon]
MEKSMAKRRPNIIFIMLDTARADYFRAYGGRLELPTIDRLSRKAVVYENAVSPATYTAPSHVSLFTGKRVASVKVLMKDKLKNADVNTDPFLVKQKLINDGELTLAKKLSYLGYNTALFSNNPLVTRFTGIAEGFSYLSYTDSVAIASQKMKKLKVRATLKMVGNDAFRKRMLELSYLISSFIPSSALDRLYLRLRERVSKAFADEAGYYSIDLGASPTNKLIGSYAKKIYPEGNFMFINYMEAHEGYPTSLVTSDYVEQDKWLYLSGILDHSESLKYILKARDMRMAYLDKQIGILLGTLKERGLLDNAVVVLAGDHGQGFMEHGQMYHNMFPYSEIVHVPLIAAKFEGGKQANTQERIAEPISITALHDALLDIGFGRSDMLDGNVKRDKYVFSEHTGITEVWDAYLLKLIRKKSKSADAIYRAKLRQNVFSTAVYSGKYKLIFYRNGKKPELYDLHEDPQETENIADSNKAKVRELLSAGLSPTS